MVPQEQLVIALAALIVAVSNAIPIVVQLWVHSRQQQTLTANSVKLEKIDANTNGALSEVKAELAAVRAELQLWKSTQPGVLPPKIK